MLARPQIFVLDGQLLYLVVSVLQLLSHLIVFLLDDNHALLQLHVLLLHIGELGGRALRRV